MDLLSSETARWLIAAWFLFLGGAVGSFLNVVVYRLPAGMNISWPGSHCPRCRHAIRAYDNIPVLAWLWLRGRCRDCRQQISFRYPLVEAVTAGLFLLLLLVEVFHEGHNLPVRISLGPAGAGPPPLSQALGICLFHLALLCTLLSAGLIRWDGKRPPRSLFVPLLLVGLVAPSIWPWLHPLPAGPETAATPWGGLVDGLLGLGTGSCWATLPSGWASVFPPWAGPEIKSWARPWRWVSCSGGRPSWCSCRWHCYWRNCRASRRWAGNRCAAAWPRSGSSFRIVLDSELGPACGGLRLA